MAKGATRRSTAVVVVAALLATFFLLPTPPASALDRPLPVTTIIDAGCDVDRCTLGWQQVNDEETLRSWDIHVNGRYRTWVAIDAGAIVEYGPGANDPRLQNVVDGDVIRIIPVRADGVWAPTNESANFTVGAGYGPGVIAGPRFFGEAFVGETVYHEIGISAAQGPEGGWGGPSAIVTNVELVGSDAFVLEGVVEGQLSCPIENPDCPREPVELPIGVSLGDQNGFGIAAAISFAPQVPGNKLGELKITHNGPDSPTIVELEGFANYPTERPTPITELLDGGCNEETCVLTWEFANDPLTLRSWDIHVNGTYRTWAPIIETGIGRPSIEYGPGAADPRLRDIVDGDELRVIPVRPDGVWASTSDSATFTVGGGFGPGVISNDEDFGSVPIGNSPEIEVVFSARLDDRDGWTGPPAIVTGLELIGADTDAFTIERLVEGQLSCPIENPDCPRNEIDLPTTVFVGDQNGFGTAATVSFTPARSGQHEVQLLVSHNGADSPTVVSLTGIGVGDRPLPVTVIVDEGCGDDSCTISWEPANDLSTLRSWDVHVNGRYRTWVAIGAGPTLDFGPGAGDTRLQTVVAGDVIRIIPVRPDGVWAPTAESANFVVAFN